MKVSIVLGIFLFVAGVFLALIQLWFTPWDEEIFLKLELTLGALLLVIFVVHFVIREYRDNKARRSGDRLDD